MKNVIIVHGCPSNAEKAMDPERRAYDKHWMPWLKRELISRGIAAETPLIPEPWKPVYENFRREFEKYSVNSSTILIGHSCSCAFLVRWLGETKTKISKLILVAPWKIPDERDSVRKEFYGHPIDRAIPSRAKEIVMFISDDEVEDGKMSLEIYHKSLGGKIIALKGRGHFTLNDMKTEEFPELLKECLKRNA